MCIRYVVVFDKMPLIEDVLTKVRNNTGLFVLYSDGEFDHVLFNNSVDISFDKEEKNILVYCFSPKLNYLEGHILQALINLGGRTSTLLPLWTKMTYEKYDEQYPTKKKYR